MDFNSDTQIRTALLEQSHFLRAWKEWTNDGEVVIIGHNDKIIGVQFNPGRNEIIRYFDIPNITFEEKHVAYLTPQNELPKWLINSLEKMKEGWDKVIVTIKNDKGSAVQFESHLTLSGNNLPWVDVNFDPPADWPKEQNYMRVRLSNRWRISSQLQNSQPPRTTKLTHEVQEAVRASEAKQWAVLQDLFRGDYAYALHSENEWLVWFEEIPYHVVVQTNDDRTEITTLEDWSGTSRGFGINPWPSSLLEDLANNGVNGEERKALHPLPPRLKTQLSEKIKDLKGS
jgi:hypothetical protein